MDQAARAHGLRSLPVLRRFLEQAPEMRPLSLRFVDDRMERRYQEAHVRDVLPYIRFAHVLGMLAWALFGPHGRDGARDRPAHGRPTVADRRAYAGPRRRRIRAVVAGVIGRRKFAYDLWGDAVNLASRLEASGEPGGILIAESTAVLVPYAYDLSEPCVLEVKGRGPTRARYLLGRSR